eukprot:GHRR01014529.1.p2 GENE.GHRR01014529.1~~GHRR01014529.1.p2  ORF type:complete len:142 (-),score=30.60 GHRR01014529.1:1572-1997(-)
MPLAAERFSVYEANNRLVTWAIMATFTRQALLMQTAMLHLPQTNIASAQSNKQAQGISAQSIGIKHHQQPGHNNLADCIGRERNYHSAGMTHKAGSFADTGGSVKHRKLLQAYQSCYHLFSFAALLGTSVSTHGQSKIATQ